MPDSERNEVLTTFFEDVDTIIGDISALKAAYDEGVDKNDNASYLKTAKEIVTKLKTSVDKIYENVCTPVNVDTVVDQENVVDTALEATVKEEPVSVIGTLKLIDLNKLIDPSLTTGKSILSESIVEISDSDTETLPKKSNAAKTPVLKTGLLNGFNSKEPSDDDTDIEESSKFLLNFVNKEISFKRKDKHSNRRKNSNNQDGKANELIIEENDSRRTRTMDRNNKKVPTSKRSSARNKVSDETATSKKLSEKDPLVLDDDISNKENNPDDQQVSKTNSIHENNTELSDEDMDNAGPAVSDSMKSSDEETVSKTDLRTSPFKSILKSSKSQKSPAKKVKFSEEEVNLKLLKSLTDTSSSASKNSESSSEEDNSSKHKKQVRTKKKRFTCKKFNEEEKKLISMQNDTKFSSECFVSVLRVSAENLKEMYEQFRVKTENAEMKRLCNMDSLKRTRKSKRNDKSSSDSNDSIKPKKKFRGMSLKKPKKAVLSSDSSGNNSDTPLGAKVPDSNDEFNKLAEVNGGDLSDKVDTADVEKMELDAILPSDHSSLGNDSDNDDDGKSKKKEKAKKKNADDDKKADDKKKKAADDKKKAAEDKKKKSADDKKKKADKKKNEDDKENADDTKIADDKKKNGDDKDDSNTDKDKSDKKNDDSIDDIDGKKADDKMSVNSGEDGELDKSEKNKDTTDDVSKELEKSTDCPDTEDNLNSIEGEEPEKNKDTNDDDSIEKKKSKDKDSSDTEKSKDKDSSDTEKRKDKDTSDTEKSKDKDTSDTEKSKDKDSSDMEKNLNTTTEDEDLDKNKKNKDASDDDSIKTKAKSAEDKELDTNEKNKDTSDNDSSKKKVKSAEDKELDKNKKKKDSGSDDDSKKKKLKDSSDEEKNKNKDSSDDDDSKQKKKKNKGSSDEDKNATSSDDEKLVKSKKNKDSSDDDDSKKKKKKNKGSSDEDKNATSSDDEKLVKSKENKDSSDDDDSKKKKKKNKGSSDEDKNATSSDDEKLDKKKKSKDSSDDDDSKKKKKKNKDSSDEESKANSSDDEPLQKNKKNKDSSSDDNSNDKKGSSDSSDEDKNSKKKKGNSKWKRDKLLSKLSDSSEDEFEKFIKKKESKFKNANSDEHKKKVPKMIIKRSKIKKVVISDSDDESSKENKSKNKKKGSDSSGDEYNKTSSSSDSSSESEKEKPKNDNPRKRRIKRVKDSSSDEDDKTTRKQIRRVWTKNSLAETTVQAEKAEAERKARIAERQEKYNNIFEADNLEKATLDKVVLDFNEETEEELLVVHKKICKKLKPHQGKGIQFMWNACFESIDRCHGTPGSGCILAHCMGLGKTLQVVALIHTLLANSEKTEVKKILVVCPLSTVLNWVAEFKKWLPDDDIVEVYDLISTKQNSDRMYQVMDWTRVGGVLIIGYDMFRNLTNGNKRLTKKMRTSFESGLVDPGPDLVVCDEGHLLKNEKTSISISMNKMRTLRRIVLTGTPLQNNLKEYFCMVQFVKPNLLGTFKEYLNRFVNPITNGQYTDSTPHDISIMRRRSHVLHKLLDGLVQRKDYAVLAPFLPPKYEYVLFISLTPTQIKLYSHYMKEFARKPAAGTRTSFLFIDFQELQRICTHPRVLLDKSIKKRLDDEKKALDDDEDEDSEGSLRNFVNDGSDDAATTPDNSGSEDAKSNSEDENAKNKKFTRRTRGAAKQAKLDGVESEEEVEEVKQPVEWWHQYTEGDELDNIIHSGKLFLLFDIINQCDLMGDKVLVFSQSLYSLNVIEYFLNVIDDASQNNDSTMVGGFSGSWSLGLDYFRLDGSSSCDNRAAWCKTFNDPSNTRARLFLISTRAGGLGINLVAANRVIIFDVSWNPSHDIQSIYRVYRFGQLKPSYVYRFVTNGTMEMKIYERQVTKQAISKRVIDEQQIDRHYNQNDLTELYKFEPNPPERPTPLVPKDILLGELLQKHENLIYTYHEHQSLLENKVDEVLDEEERKAAWDEFQNEKIQRQYTGAINNIPMNAVVAAFKSIVKRERPSMTDAEINGVTPQLITEMQNQLDVGDSAIYNKILAEVRNTQAMYQQQRMQEMYRVQQQQQARLAFQQYQQQVQNGSSADMARFMAQWQQQMGGNMPGMMGPGNMGGNMGGNVGGNVGVNMGGNMGGNVSQPTTSKVKPVSKEKSSARQKSATNSNVTNEVVNLDD